MFGAVARRNTPICVDAASISGALGTIDMIVLMQLYTTIAATLCRYASAARNVLSRHSYIFSLARAFPRPSTPSRSTRCICTHGAGIPM